MKSINKYITDEIKRRYFIPGNTQYTPNKISDEFCLKEGLLDSMIITKDRYVISEYFSKSFGIRQLPFKFMLQTLNISDAKLKSLVLAVKRKNLNFIFAGFGGTGTNTAYWLHKILDHTGDVYLFNKVYVHDDDKIELHNIFRFPQDISASTAKYKSDLYDNRNSLGRRYSISKSRLEFVDPDSTHDLATLENFDHPDYNVRQVFNESTIIYGAPDLETRKQAALTNCKFIAATHGGNSCSMTVRPEIDENIQTEGYGVIHLNTFFWNQLAMAIGLLEFLASDDIISVDMPELNEDGTPVLNLDGTHRIRSTDMSKWDQDGRIFHFCAEDFLQSDQIGRASCKLDFNITRDEGGRG